MVGAWVFVVGSSVCAGWWLGGGRTADQTSPCAVGRESDPSNVLEVYCDTPAGTRKKGEQIFPPDFA